MDAEDAGGWDAGEIHGKKFAGTFAEEQKIVSVIERTGRYACPIGRPTCWIFWGI
jgi:hypothetical protein